MLIRYIRYKKNLNIGKVSTIIYSRLNGGIKNKLVFYMQCAHTIESMVIERHTHTQNYFVLDIVATAI